MRFWRCALATVCVLAGCSPPPPSWPEVGRVEVRPEPVRGRRLVLPSAYESFLRGQISYTQGDYAEASRHIKAALRTDPESAYLHAWVAKVELDGGNVDAAHKAVSKALSYDACHELAYCVKAQILTKQSDTDAAMVSYRRAIACEPREPSAYLELAELLTSGGAPQRAEEVYHQLVEAVGPHPTALERLAELALARGQSHVASEHLVELMSLEPWRAAAVSRLAEIHLEEGNTIRARALAQAVVSGAPRDDASRILLVRVLLAAGDTRGAVSHIDRLLPDETSASNLLSLAELNLSAHRYAEAEAEARRALSLDPSLHQAHVVLGTALRYLSRGQEALRQLEAVPENSPQADQACAQRGALLWEQGHIDEARSLLSIRLSGHPTSRASRSLLAQIEEDQGDVPAAEELLRGAGSGEDLFPLVELLLRHQRLAEAAQVSGPLVEGEALPQALALHARVLVRSGQELSAAADLAAQAHEARPFDPETLFALGLTRSHLGAHEQALDAMSRASALRPTSVLFLGELALAHGRADQCDRAAELSARALRLSPRPELRAALESLQSSCR